MTDDLRAAKISNSQIEEARKVEHLRLIAEMERILGYGIKRFANAQMLLVRALYSLAYSENRGLAMNNFARAEMRGPSVEESFTIFFYRRLNEEEFMESEKNADILSYMAFQKTMADARRFDELSTKYQLQFWEELLKATTDTNRMSDIASLLNSNMVQAQDCYRRLMRMNGNSAQVLRTYASFLIDIANEGMEGNKLLAKAEDLEEQSTKAHERGESGNALFDDRNALISISGEISNAGEIISVNSGVARMFGYTRSELLGRNIALAMPQPFASQHQGFLMRYLETGKTKIIGSQRVLYGLHRSGWLIPLDVFVREVSSSEGASFLAVLRRPKNSALAAIVPSLTMGADGQPRDLGAATLNEEVIKAVSASDANQNVHFAFVDMQGRVTGCTVGCVGLFGNSIDEVRANLVNLTSWLPCFEDPELVKQINTPAGLQTTVKNSAGRTLHLHVIQALIEVGVEKMWLVHIGERLAVAAGRAAAKNVEEDEEDEDEEEGDDVSVSDDDEDDEEEAEDEEAQSEAIGEEVERASRSHAEEEEEEEEEEQQAGQLQGVDAEMDEKEAALSPASIEMTNLAAAKQQQQPQQPQLGPDGKPKKALSHHSGSSKSSGSSSMQSVGALHQRLISFARSRENRDLSEGIQRLRFSLVTVLLFVCAIAIARYALMDSQVLDFSSRLNTLFMAGTRRYLSIRLALMAHVMLMGPLVDSQGNYWANFWTEQQVDPARDVMEYDCKQMEAINNLLYIQRRGQLTAAHDTLYTSNAVNTWHARPSDDPYKPPVIYSLPMSLWDASQMLITQSRVYSKMRILDIIDTDPTVYFVLRNSIARKDGELFAVLNRTCFLYQDDAVSSLGAMRSWAIAFLAAGIVAVIFVAFVVVRPKVLVVERNKESVLMLFADVPTNLINLFFQKTQRRLNSLKAAAQGIEEEEGDELDEQQHLQEGVENAEGGAEGEGAEADEEKNAQGDEEEKSGVADASDESGATGASSVPAGSSLVSDRALRRARKKADRIQTNASFMKRNSTMIKVCAVVLLTIAYYVASYVIEFGQFSRALTTSPGQVNWSQHRRLSLLLLVYDLRHILTQKFWKDYEAGNPDIVDVTESEFFSDLTLLNDIESGLAFGTDRFTVDPPVAGIQEQLMFERDLTCTT